MGKFLLKLVANGAIAVPLILWFSEARLFETMIAASVLSVIAYFLGDRFILGTLNNTVATIADFGLAFVYFWAVGSFLYWDGLTLGDIFWVSAALTLFELWFHTTLPQGDDRRKATA